MKYGHKKCKYKGRMCVHEGAYCGIKFRLVCTQKLITKSSSN